MAAADSEKDNRMVWDGTPGRYEVWYATFSHRASGTGFWIRYTVEAPRAGDGVPYAQLWFSRFDRDDAALTFGVSKRFPIEDFVATAHPVGVTIGGAEFRHDRMRGSLAGGVGAAAHEIEWNLRWEPSAVTYRHYPEVLYKVERLKSKLLSPNPDISISGSIVVDGRSYVLDGEPGAQSHVWGQKHAYSWAWSHCNAFEQVGASGGNAWFESVSGRLKIGQVISPTISAFTLHLPDEEIGFRELWTLPLASSTYGTGSYHLIGTNLETRVEVQLTARPEDTMLVEYLDPDGDPAFNHITCTADALVTVKKRSPFASRFRDHLTLRSNRMAHFEWGARAGDVANVKKQLVAI